MKIQDILSESIDLNEGGASGAVRYNSESAFLFACAGVTETFNLNDIPSNFDVKKLHNPESIFSEMEKLLVPNYNEKIFERWYNLAKSYMSKIISNSGQEPSQYGWVGGANAAEGAADIDFYGHPTSGVSIKDEGGITLSNLTPKALGIEPPRNVDVFAHLAQKEFDDMKVKVFNVVLDAAKAQPDVTLVPNPKASKYTITYISEDDEYICQGKKTIKASAQEIISKSSINSPWQRVFGEYFQQNYQQMKQYAAPLFKKIAVEIEHKIEEKLADSAAIANILRFVDDPYYYASTKAIYLVPSAKDATDIVTKGIKYANPNGTSQRFLANFGQADSDDYATADIYIRYANGMFETNPTVRVQSLSNPQFISWDKL